MLALVPTTPTLKGRLAMKYGLLWFLGIPIPVLIVLYLMFH